MTSKEKKELSTCTKRGLLKLINNPNYGQNKANQFPAIVGYLARHGMNSSTTREEFLDLVYTARSELLRQAGEKHATTGNPFDYNDLGTKSKVQDARVRAFIQDPVTTIRNELQNLYQRQENYAGMEDPDEVAYFQRLKTNANIISITLMSADQEKERFAKQPEMVDIVSRISQKMPEKDKDLNASLKRINSGFFGTLFRRPSKEYAAFEESFNNYRNAASALSGNLEDLEKKTTAYLKHTIPDFKFGKDMPKQQWLDALPKGKRARAEFAMNVLESVAEHKKLKPFVDNVEKAANGRPIDASVDPKPLFVEQVEQLSFQNEIQKEVEQIAKKEEKVVEAEEKEPAVEQGGIEP